MRCVRDQTVEGERAVPATYRNKRLRPNAIITIVTVTNQALGAPPPSLDDELEVPPELEEELELLEELLELELVVMVSVVTAPVERSIFLMAALPVSAT